MKNHDMEMTFPEGLRWRFTCDHCGRSTESMQAAMALQLTPCRARERRWWPSLIAGVLVALAGLLPATEARAGGHVDLVRPSYGL